MKRPVSAGPIQYLPSIPRMEKFPGNQFDTAFSPFGAGQNGAFVCTEIEKNGKFIDSGIRIEYHGVESDKNNNEREILKLSRDVLFRV